MSHSWRWNSPQLLENSSQDTTEQSVMIIFGTGVSDWRMSHSWRWNSSSQLLQPSSQDIKHMSHSWRWNSSHLLEHSSWRWNSSQLLGHSSQDTRLLHLFSLCIDWKKNTPQGLTRNEADQYTGSAVLKTAKNSRSGPSGEIRYLVQTTNDRIPLTCYCGAGKEQVISSSSCSSHILQSEYSVKMLAQVAMSHNQTHNPGRHRSAK
ncbi:hypothetical protein J6590_085239 [Homalodisca vitripennis]|nr:hypothetical protein J6590_085239 [Homalodisca vitripennis]